MKISFDPEKIRQAISVAKLTKPASGDFTLKFTGGDLVICSQGKRGQSWAQVAPLEPNNDFVSDEAFLPYEKSLFLEGNNDTCTLVFDDSYLSIKVRSGGSNKSARVPLRNNNTKRSKLPEKLDLVDPHPIDKKVWSEILGSLSYSAQVKNTKTDIEMRQNQIYFYGDQHAAYSNARTYASCATHESLDFSVSIISSDVPTVRAFIQKAGDDIMVGVNDGDLFFCSEDRNRYVSFARMVNKFPAYKIPSTEGFKHHATFKTEEWKKNVTWSVKAVEGNNKVLARFSSDSVSILDGSKELISFMPSSCDGDFSFYMNLDILVGISSVINSDEFTLCYAHESMDNMIEFRDNGQVQSRHFFTAVKT